MLLNADVAIESATSDTVLVPYREEHVPVYHEWMSSPELLRLTASEPLSLEEEYISMRRWREDEDKLTFIVCSKGIPGFMVGDVNLVRNIDLDRPRVVEVDVMVAAPSARRRGIASEALRLMMSYARQHFDVDAFVAKIVEDNAPSIALFEKMGFVMVKHVPAFGEIHYELAIGDRSNGIQNDACFLLKSYESSYADMCRSDLRAE